MPPSPPADVGDPGDSITNNNQDQSVVGRFRMVKLLLLAVPVLTGWYWMEYLVEKAPLDVDHWLKTNTFDHRDFPLEELLKLKLARNLSISVVLPAKNEADTVGQIVSMIRSSLMDSSGPPTLSSNSGSVQLVDELIVMDSDSTDQTFKVSQEAGAIVYEKREVLPELGNHPGKGETLWKSLQVARGDIIVWLDADVTNNGPHFITGLVAPLLKNDSIVYAKGFYERPLIRGGVTLKGEGGRVTELSVRPLLQHFYPKLTRFYQPLSGEYAILREVALDQSFFINYGVEMGLLIDLSQKYGLEAIAQVNLDKRTHKNRGLKHLSNMAFEVITVMMKRAGLADKTLADQLGIERPPIRKFIS